MAKITHDIRAAARALIASHPGGIRYRDLRKMLQEQNPAWNHHTIEGSIWDLDAVFPNEIAKPSRGVFQPISDSAIVEPIKVGDTEQVSDTGKQIREADFYEPFAEWVKNELGEVTKVAALGRSAIRTKWGTPDVFGVYKPLAKDLIEFPIEIVSAQIKIDPFAPVVAFGQAVAYRLFSTKTYIAMPTTLTENDRSRLEALCMLFGVGLALFELNPDIPDFDIRVRAQRFYPDMFYVNEFAERLKTNEPDIFQDLFG